MGRVTAIRPGTSPRWNNIMDSLSQRKVGGKNAREFRRENMSKKFSDFGIKEELDVFGSWDNKKLARMFRRRSLIAELICAEKVLFTLTGTGICCAFDLTTKKRLCFINQSDDEIIRSLFYNKFNDSLVTVSVQRSDNFSSLRCRTTPLAYVLRKQPEHGYLCFEGECLTWPGFVEFDDNNNKVLTYNAKKRVYKLWDLRNYDYLYSIDEPDVQEVKLSPGALFIIYERSQSFLQMNVVDVETGHSVQKWRHMIHRNKRVALIELFNESILFKQENSPLEIISIAEPHSRIITISDEVFPTPSAFIFLYESQQFLTFHNRKITAWNEKGHVLSRFKDHTLRYRDISMNNIYVTKKQDMLLSVVSVGEDTDERDGNNGLDSMIDAGINISDVATGRCIGKIRSSGDNVTNVLDDVTALVYDETSDTVFTGSSAGYVHMWSAGEGRTDKEKSR